jgi:hypothetical protein
VAAICTTVASQPVVAAVVIAAARVTEGDARLWEMVLSSVHSLGTYSAN